MFVIEFIHSQEVKDGDQGKGNTRFNSGNHWVDNVKPKDYNEVLSKVETRYWIDKFHQDYSKIDIPKSQLGWLKSAARIGSQTGKFPSGYKEELDDFTQDKADFEHGYFVRSENVSLKTGQHGCIPYKNLKQILESAVTSKVTHSPIEEERQNLTFYLLPWVNIDPGREFRVFVRGKRIIACSQQHLYKGNPHLQDCEDNDPHIPQNLHEKRVDIVKGWCSIIFDYIEKTVIPKIDHIDSYVVDIALLDNEQPYFIEINCYGKEYGAGSALFHWLNDSHIFDTNIDSNDIYIRMTI